MFAPCPTVREDVKARVTLECAQSLVEVEVTVPDMSPEYFHDGFQLGALAGNEIGLMYGSDDEDKYLYLRISQEEDRPIGWLDREEAPIQGTSERVFYPSGEPSSVGAFWVVGERGFELWWPDDVENGRELALEMASQTHVGSATDR